MDTELPRIEAPLATVVSWLNENGSDIPFSWVPGANKAQLGRLGALGGLVRALLSRLGPDSYLEDPSTHPDIRKWLEDGASPPPFVIDAAVEVIATEDSGLASLYTSAVSAVSRRTLGTFFTPRQEAEWMVRRWGETHPDPATIIDVGAGVGAFTFVAARQWPSASLKAIDVNPVTLGLLALGISETRSSDRRIDGSRVELVLEDYVAWVGRELGSTSPSRLILGNPPYTRLQLLPISERRRLVDAAGGLCGSRASLSALMTAASIRAMGAQDGLCLLLPAHWLEADYASGLRKWLWGQVGRRVEVHLFEAELFADAQVDAVALIIGPEQNDTQPFVVSGSEGGAARPDEFMVATKERFFETPRLWRSMFTRGPENPRSEVPTVSLKQFARVRRGVATGANSFFVISGQVAKELELSGEFLVPIVRRLRDQVTNTVSAKDLLKLPLSKRSYMFLVESSRTLPDSIANYIASGERAGYQSGLLCQRREFWFDLSREVVIPDVIVGPAHKSHFRFIENEAMAAITNNLYGLTWLPTTTEGERAKILAWLRSNAGQAELLRASRTQGGGLKKVEPRALQELRMPRSLSGSERPPN